MVTSLSGKAEATSVMYQSPVAGNAGCISLVSM